MIESFDKDLELAIDKKMVEKQHKLVVDSLKRSGVGVKLEDEAELSAKEYLQDLVGRLELLETKYNPVAAGNALKKMFDKLSAGPTPHEENVAEIIRDIRRGKNVC